MDLKDTIISTIVEILYVFAPIVAFITYKFQSTIVEILYVFAPNLQMQQQRDPSTIVEILYVFAPYDCKNTDYK